MMAEPTNPSLAEFSFGDFRGAVCTEVKRGVMTHRKNASSKIPNLCSSISHSDVTLRHIVFGSSGDTFSFTG